MLTEVNYVDGGGGGKVRVGSIASLGSSWTDVTWESALDFTPKRLVGYYKINWATCPIMGFDYDVENATYLATDTGGYDVTRNDRIGTFVQVSGSTVQFKSIDSTYNSAPIKVVAIG